MKKARAIAVLAGDTHGPTSRRLAATAGWLGTFAAVAGLVPAAALAVAAADDFEAYFNLANWSLVNAVPASDGHVTSQPGPPVQLFVHGGGNDYPGHTDFVIAIPVAGEIRFHWGYDNTEDVACLDSGGYVVDGEYTVLACNDSPVGFFMGSAVVPVVRGQHFAFRVWTEDGLEGAGVLGITGFSFRPRQVFADRFETPAVTPFRIGSLKLRDPHTYLSLAPFGCLDATESLPFDLPGANSLIDQQVQGDANGDGFFDLSLLLLFGAPGGSGANPVFRLAEGACARPPAAPGCFEYVDGGLIDTGYWNQAAGVCLAPLPGTTRPFEPPVPVIEAACFASVAADGQITAGPFQLPLGAVQAGGTLGDVGAIAPGLIRGFLRESDADQILLPGNFPVVGGQPLSRLFAGGSGNCSVEDDRDTHAGESGWWIYLEYTAARVRMHH